MGEAASASLHGAPETLDYIPPWMIDRLRHLSDEHAARISLSGPQAPHALDGIAADRAGRDLLPYLPETGKIVNLRTTNWCVAPAPTPDWAAAVYPGRSTRTRRTTGSGRRSRTSAGSTPTTRWRRGASAWRR